MRGSLRSYAWSSIRNCWSDRRLPGSVSCLGGCTGGVTDSRSGGPKRRKIDRPARGRSRSTSSTCSPAGRRIGRRQSQPRRGGGWRHAFSRFWKYFVSATVPGQRARSESTSDLHHREGWRTNSGQATTPTRSGGGDFPIRRLSLAAGGKTAYCRHADLHDYPVKRRVVHCGCGEASSLSRNLADRCPRLERRRSLIGRTTEAGTQKKSRHGPMIATALRHHDLHRVCCTNGPGEKAIDVDQGLDRDRLRARGVGIGLKARPRKRWADFRALGR